MSDVVAVLCADLHLSEKPSTFRSKEPDWFLAMSRPLFAIGQLCRWHDASLLIAGDIFDKWNSSPAIVNFAIAQFREMHTAIYAVPGQHDLPYHSLDQIEKSAYETLVRAGVIISLSSTYSRQDGILHLVGIPWGVSKHNNFDLEGREGDLYVAVIHQYCWNNSHNPARSTDSSGNVTSIQKEFQDFDVVVVGDNHRGFRVLGDDYLPTIWNCGTLMRRKSDELHYVPRVGLLREDGTITQHNLLFNEDVFLDVKEIQSEKNDGLKHAIDHLQQLMSPDSLDYRGAVEQLIVEAKVGRQVCRIVQECLQE